MTCVTLNTQLPSALICLHTMENASTDLINLFKYIHSLNPTFEYRQFSRVPYDYWPHSGHTVPTQTTIRIQKEVAK